mmetsp:Transcript_123824/g.219460  ORF Transcript_123824/g.219460 Transcript_123824/m.219460 type:complete len:359 (+) Transcript_123824:94-1170(+)
MPLARLLALIACAVQLTNLEALCALKDAAKAPLSRDIPGLSTAGNPVIETTQHKPQRNDIVIVFQIWASRVLGIDEHQKWYSDWKIWCGLAGYVMVWFKWLCYGYERKYHIKGVFVFSVNLLILHLVEFYQYTGFVMMLLMITVQNLMSAKVFYRDVDLMERQMFIADCIYSAVSYPLLQACFVFLGQLLFIGFYFYTLWNGLEDIKETGKSNYFFWMAGYIAVQMTLYFNRGKDSQIGTVMDVSSSIYILKNIRQLRFSWTTFTGQKSPVFKITRAHWSVRCFMNFVANMLIRDLIAYTVPVLLMSFQRPLNCVIYSVAVNFIATMDDVGDMAYDLTWHDDTTGSLESEPKETTQPG